MRFRYLIGPNSCVDSADRGLAYGDGLFETMARRGGALQRFEMHYDRLRQGAQRLGIPMPERNELAAQLEAAAADIDDGCVKLILTRGSGPRGYAPPTDPVPTVIVSAAPIAQAPATELDLVTLGTRLGENVKLAGIKHLCRLEQVLGRLELQGLDADEGLMLSTSGAVIGGTSRNLFAVFGRRLVTPDVSRAGIRGVMRRAVLEACATIGLSGEEAVLEPDDLERAGELFMTNALVGIQSVRRLDDRRFERSDRASQLRDALGLTGDA